MDARSLNRQVLGLAVAAIMAGCEGPGYVSDLERLPILYETDEVEVATAFDEPLCEGDLRWLDSATHRVEQLLGVEGGGLRTVYAYEEDDVIVEDDGVFILQVPGCSPDILGCYRRRERLGLGVPQVLAHELVHLVSEDIEPSFVRFWYEGLADALSEHPLIYQPADLVAESTSDEVRYDVPAHFIRWLIEREGIEPVIRVFKGDPFEDAFGTSLESMERIYDAEAPEVMPSPFACADEPTIVGDDGSFEIAAELDCTLVTTTRIRHLSSFDRIADIRIITTESDTTYLVEADGLDQVRIGGCQAGPGDLVERLGDVENDANIVAGINPAVTTEVHPDQEVFLPAATYRVVLLAHDTGAPQPFRFSLTPVE